MPTIDPTTTSTTTKSTASPFLRNKARALASLLRKAKAAPDNEDTRISVLAEMEVIFDVFLQGHADENAIEFPTAAEAAVYAEALDFLRKHRPGKFASIVVGVECYGAAE
jgi:hypothetical protein